MGELQLRQISVAYGGRRVLEDVTATVMAGALTGIIGPNGAGKSTLLKAILGLVPRLRGEVTYGGSRLRREQVAYVPQRQGVDWQYPATVLDVVLMGRVRAMGWYRRFDRRSYELAQAALEQVGMEDFQDRPIGSLSGGQQQRVFLARALAQEGEILLLDEPLAGIDLKNQGFIVELLQGLAGQGKVVAWVHHDLGAVLRHCDHLLLLNRRLVAAGPPRLVLSPELLRTAYGEGLMLAEAA